MNKISFFLITLSFFIISGITQAQDKERVGMNQVFSQQGGFYNYGEKDKVNIEVSIWGYVKYPGKYIIPQGSTLVDLVSYAGGPVVDAKLENIRLFRPKNDTLNITKDEMMVFDYNDVFWGEKVVQNYKRNICVAIFKRIYIL